MPIYNPLSRFLKKHCDTLAANKAKRYTTPSINKAVATENLLLLKNASEKEIFGSAGVHEHVCATQQQLLSNRE